MNFEWELASEGRIEWQQFHRQYIAKKVIRPFNACYEKHIPICISPCVRRDLSDGNA